MRRPSQRPQPPAIRGTALAAAAIAGALVLTACTASQDSSSGFVTDATLPTPTAGPDGTIERPTTPAPLIAADGPCLALFTDMRDLMSRYDTGRTERSAQDNDKFNQYLNQINQSKAGEGPCTVQQANAFMVQEVGQWLLWAPTIAQSADDSGSTDDSSTDDSSTPAPQISGKAG